MPGSPPQPRTPPARVGIRRHARRHRSRTRSRRPAASGSSASATYRRGVDFERDGPSEPASRAAHGNGDAWRSARPPRRSTARVRVDPERDDRRPPEARPGSAQRGGRRSARALPRIAVGLVELDPGRLPHDSGRGPELDRPHARPSAPQLRHQRSERARPRQVARAPTRRPGCRSETAATESFSGNDVQTWPCASGVGSTPSGVADGSAGAFQGNPRRRRERPAGFLDHARPPLDPFGAEARVLRHAHRGLRDAQTGHLRGRGGLEIGQPLLEEKDEDARRQRKAREKARSRRAPTLRRGSKRRQKLSNGSPDTKGF